MKLINSLKLITWKFELEIEVLVKAAWKKARDAVESILAIDPRFSSEAFSQGLPFSDPDMQARRELALKKAGMP